MAAFGDGMMTEDRTFERIQSLFDIQLLAPMRVFIAGCGSGGGSVVVRRRRRSALPHSDEQLVALREMLIARSDTREKALRVVCSTSHQQRNEVSARGIEPISGLRRMCAPIRDDLAERGARVRVAPRAKQGRSRCRIVDRTGYDVRRRAPKRDRRRVRGRRQEKRGQETCKESRDALERPPRVAQAH